MGILTKLALCHVLAGSTVKPVLIGLCLKRCMIQSCAMYDTLSYYWKNLPNNYRHFTIGTRSPLLIARLPRHCFSANGKGGSGNFRLRC